MSQAPAYQRFLPKPNLDPPIITVAHALDYKRRLQLLEPKVDFLMTLYLHPSITPEVIREASEAGIAGVKCYPHGLTTNSSSGVVDYEPFWPVFAEMEKAGMVLNLHGEAPSGGHVTILSAEEEFLPTLRRIHLAFPRLRIVLEHATTKAAVDMVLELGETVAATITAHHLFLIVDDWANDPFNYCKPVAKLPRDRDALLGVVLSGSPKFFLGTDSAPHPKTSKQGQGSTNSKTAAGVFTQPYATQLVTKVLMDHCLFLSDPRNPPPALTKITDLIGNFTSKYGRNFYRRVDSRNERIRIYFGGEESLTAQSITHPSGPEVVNFRAGQPTPQMMWITK